MGLDLNRAASLEYALSLQSFMNLLRLHESLHPAGGVDELPVLCCSTPRFIGVGEGRAKPIRGR